MTARRIRRIRFVAGILLATVVAILILKYADTQNPAAQPSHLWEEGNDFSITSLPWWLASGGAIGVVAGLVFFRVEVESQMRRGMAMASCTIVLVAVILAFLSFKMSGYSFTLQQLAIVAGLDIVEYFILATLPALACLALVSMLTSRPARRSAVDIMPRELREQYLQRTAQAAQQKKFALPGWLVRRKEHESSLHP
jgi:hypothetical protein